MSRSPFPRYQIVEQRPSRRGFWLALAGMAWAGTLAGVWFWASHTAAPRLGQAQRDLAQVRARLGQQQGELRRLSQRETTLGVSDRISRTANQELQASLAERDEEIAGLRADVAFYERLVGATAPRRGLSVHLAEFSRAPGGAWQYQITLTQTLNRGAISEGRMRFAVEGVRGGQLATVGWDELHQQPGVAGQAYSFRYFQQLDGSVMLPGGFTPQRVKVQLSGGDNAVEQAFDWKLATSAGSAGGK